MNWKGLIGTTILGLTLILSACESTEESKTEPKEKANHAITTQNEDSTEIEELSTSKTNDNKPKDVNDANFNTKKSNKNTQYVDDFEEEPPFKFLPKNGKIVKVASTKENQKFISKTHDFYNKMLGYKNDQSINSEKQSSKAKDLISKINNLQTEAIDLLRARALAQIYLDNNDKKALIYIHRIFHDLDIAINGYEAQKVWGFTYTSKRKEDTDVIGRYIEDNDNE